MSKDEHYRKLERMYRGAPINAYYAPEIGVDKGMATVRMAITEKFYHAAGAAHGSVYFKMLDDACFFAVSSLVQDVFVLTVSFTTYLTRPISIGSMQSTGRVVSASKRLFVAEAELVSTEGKLLGRGSGTFMKSTIALDAAVGYE